MGLLISDHHQHISPKRIIFKISSCAAIGVVILLFLLATILFSLQTRPVQKIIQSKISQTIPGTISWDRLRFSLVRGAVQLHGLEILDPENNRVAGVASLELAISLQALRQHTFRVKKLHCKGISADIIADSLQQLNIVKAFAGNSPEKGTESDSAATFNWNFIADDVQIETDKLAFLNAAGGITTGLADLSLSANGNWDGRIATLGLAIDSGWFSNPAISLPLSGLTFTSKLAKDSVEGLAITVKSGNTMVDLHGSLSRVFDAPQGSLTGIIRADLSEIDKIFNLGDSYSGIVSVEIAAAGNLKKPEAILSLDFAGKKVAGYPVDSIRGAISLKEMVCTVPTMVISTGTGTVKLRADADFREAFPGGFFDSLRNVNKLSGEAEITAKNVVLSAIDTSLPNGIIDLAVSAKTEGVHPDSMNGSLILSTSVKGLTAKGVTVPLSGMVNLHADISGGRVTVKKASVRANSLALDLKGSADVPRRTMKLAMDISAPNLTEVTAPLGIKGLEGAVTSQLTVRGNFTNPQANVNLHASNLGFSDITIGDITLISHLSPDGTVRVEELLTHNKDSELKITGYVNLFRKGSFTLLTPPHLELSVMSNGIVLQNFLDSIMGTITLAAEVSGSPDNLTGKIKLTADSIVTGVQDIQSASVQASILGDSITLERLTVRLDKNNFLTANGFYTLEKKFEAYLKADNISLQSIEAISKKGALDGTVSLQVTGSGSAGAPRISGKLALADFTLGSKPLQGLDAAFSLLNDTVTLNGTGLAGIDAQLGIKDGGFSADLVFDSTNLAPLWLLAGRKEMAGLLDGKITATGNIHKSERISAETDLAIVTIQHRDLNLVSGRDIRINYDSGIFSIPGISFTILDKGQISIHGSGSIDSVIGFGIDAAIPLTVAVPFVPDLPDLAGMLLLKGTLSGTVKKPEYHLSAEVAGASFTIPGLEQSLNSLTLKAGADTSMFTLEHLKGKIGGGSFKLSGSAGHSNFRIRTLLAQLTCNNLPIEIPETMETLLDGNLKLTGDSSAAAITGELIVLEGLYYKPVNIAGLITPREKRRTLGPSPDTAKSGFLDKTTLDIAVKSRSTFTVDNNLASMEIKPDVQIKGTLKKPAISGRGKVESGVIKWQKRDLIITRGVVDFLNPYETQATLDIASEISIRDWIIQLGITGTAPDGLTLSLSEKNANPPLPDADIISILATGRTTAELLGGEGGKTKEQLLASLLATEVSKRLQNGTLLDKVEIEAGSEGDPSGTRDLKVTVGKNISRRLTTLYSFETGSNGIVQRGSAEYKLLERVLLSGFQDTEGTYGGALEWNLQWR